MFLMRCQQFASYAHCEASGPVSKMATQQKKLFCVLHLDVSSSVITVQREFRAQFKNELMLVWCVPFKPCTKLTLHFSHRSGHL
jgi:hypothetical protein